MKLNKILVEEITKSIHELVDTIGMERSLPVKAKSISLVKIQPGILSKMIKHRQQAHDVTGIPSLPGSTIDAAKVCGSEERNGKKNTSTKSKSENQTEIFPGVSPKDDVTPEFPDAESAIDVDIKSDKLPLIKRVLSKMKWLKSSLGEEYVPTYYDSGNKLYELYRPYKNGSKNVVLFVENSSGVLYKLNIKADEYHKIKT